MPNGKLTSSGLTIPSISSRPEKTLYQLKDSQVETWTNPWDGFQGPCT